MPRTRLTDMTVRTLKPPLKGQVDHWDQTLPGFGCRVSQGGAKAFLLKHDNRRITIGKYPIVSLGDAREAAKRLLAEFTLGRLRPQSLRYQEAVQLFLADKAKSARPRTVADYTRHLSKHFPFKGQLAEVTHAQVAQRLDRLKETPAEHNHARTVVMIFFNWCKERRYLTDNPAVGITAFARERRSRILSGDELKRIWNACQAETDLSRQFRTIVQLLILLGQRETETAALHRDWIDRDAITFPSSITKNKNQHTLPIGTRARALLAREKEASLLFPAKNKPDKPFCGWGKAKARLDELSGVTGWTLHDIRRTFRSGLGALGVAPHIAERMVNHISARTDMERTYDLYKYLPEMRAAIELWESKLDSLFQLPLAA
jgi:integrase